MSFDRMTTFALVAPSAMKMNPAMPPLGGEVVVPVPYAIAATLAPATIHIEAPCTSPPLFITTTTSTPSSSSSFSTFLVVAYDQSLRMIGPHSSTSIVCRTAASHVWT